MGDLMNGKGYVVIRGAADCVREEQEPKRERMRVPELYGDKNL